MTTITSAARRIARHLNAERRRHEENGAAVTGWRYFFDADGREVATIYGREAHGPAENTYAYAWSSVAQPVTYAAVQASLDVAAESAQLTEADA